MPLAIIPKKQAEKSGVVVISGKEYQEYLDWKLKSIPEIEPTKEERRIFREGRKSFARGDYITLDQLKKKLQL